MELHECESVGREDGWGALEVSRDQWRMMGAGLAVRAITVQPLADLGYGVEVRTRTLETAL